MPCPPMFSSPTSPAAAFLQGQPWHDSLPPERQREVLERLTLLQAAKGECLLSMGVPVQGWYAVLSGLVKLQSASADGRVQAFLGVPSGEWFGEGSALKAERRRYDVIALRDTSVLCLPLPLFESLRQTSLAFNQYLVAHLNRRLGQAMALIEAERLRSAEERVALYLSRVFWPGTRRLSLSQEELGHLVGLSRQTVNRVLGRMAQQGLVSLTFGRVEILDEPALLGYPPADAGPAAGKRPCAPASRGG